MFLSLRIINLIKNLKIFNHCVIMKTTTIESIVGISPEFLSKGDIKKAIRNKIDEIFFE